MHLDGDGQHAGFQFRAPQQVHKNQKATVYLRPASVGKPKNDMWVGCAWTLCRYDLDDKPVAVMYMTAPENPTPAAMSTRAYGRFGSFFKTAASVIRVTVGGGAGLWVPEGGHEASYLDVDEEEILEGEV